MSRDTFDYTHGDTGTAPADGEEFQSNERPDSEVFDWFWYNVIESINGHSAEFDRIDSDDDGVVDEADYANDADASTYKGNDLDSDGDGTVDAADAAAAVSDSGAEVVAYPSDINLLDKLSASDDGDGTVSISTSALDEEEVEDAINALLSAGTNLSLSYDDENDTLTFDAKSDEEIQDLVAALLTAGDKLSINYDDAGNSLTLNTSALDAEEVEDQVQSLLTAGNHLSMNYDDSGDSLTLNVSDDWVDATGDTITGAIQMEGEFNANNANGGRVVLPVGTDKWA